MIPTAKRCATSAGDGKPPGLPGLRGEGSASSPGWEALEAVCSMPAGTELAGAGERAGDEGEAVRAVREGANGEIPPLSSRAEGGAGSEGKD